MMKSNKFNFFEDAQAVVRLIPKGRVTSYGAIARYLSAPRSARMVGYAMKSAANDPTVPAQRVVNRMGMLSGKGNFDPPSKMQDLLIAEGVQIKDDVVVDFEKVFWDPSKSLQI